MGSAIYPHNEVGLLSSSWGRKAPGIPLSGWKQPDQIYKNQTGHDVSPISRGTKSGHGFIQKMTETSDKFVKRQ